MRKPSTPLVAWISTMVLVLSLGALYYCLSGYAMVASMSVAHPERLGYWQRGGIAYFVGSGLSLVCLVGSGVALWRRRLASAPADVARTV